MSSPTVAFKRLLLPSSPPTWTPSDPNLRLPGATAIDPCGIHALTYIPWEDRYLEPIDPLYRPFLLQVLPVLHVRTTDVHVATCLPFAAKLLHAETEPLDARLVHLAFILHDGGWSQLTDSEIKASLGVSGLALSAEAVGPKVRHAELGRNLAEHLLKAHPLGPPLPAEQECEIYQAILYNDRLQELAGQGDLPATLRRVCDVDHLWSFTHENFWQDTACKRVTPEAYLRNLRADLQAGFVGEPARRTARKMLAARADEVHSWQAWRSQHDA
jgi:hypothetical protein